TGIVPEFVLFLDCPEKEMEKRLLGRNQSREDEYYNSKEKVRKIDAAKPIGEVFEYLEKRGDGEERKGGGGSGGEQSYGGFTGCLQTDVKELISLYEASHLAFVEERCLEYNILNLPFIDQCSNNKIKTNMINSHNKITTFLHLYVVEKYRPSTQVISLRLTKVCALITVIDDYYDVYGFVDELEIFTDAIKGMRLEEVKMKLIKVDVDCSQEFTNPFIDMTINLARISCCTYQYGDGHGAHDARAKDRIFSVIIEPITIKKWQCVSES
ncbi:LOW QUALITY PROTEIN: hypothetical protein M8C21_020255, partial [Ambrosia artemisiifolia]